MPNTEGTKVATLLAETRMSALPQINFGEAINIALTAGAAGVVTLITASKAARSAVVDELAKLRNARGFERRANWYEYARRELRELGGYGGAIMKATVEAEHGGGEGLRSSLYKQHADAIGTVRELILDAIVYATPETVAVLGALGEALEELSPLIVVLTGTLREDPEMTAMLEAISKSLGEKPSVTFDTLASQQQQAALCVSTIHAKMILAITHILDETRSLHGYPEVDVSAALPASAIVGAALEPAPKRRSRPAS